MPVISLNDLSEVMIEEVTKLYGLSKENIKIEEIGLKPGEKMYEELMTHDESLQAFELPDMFIIPSPLKRVLNMKMQKGRRQAFTVLIIKMLFQKKSLEI